MLEDLAVGGAAGARIVEAGFVDFRMCEVAIDVPPLNLDPSDRAMHCELAAAELRRALKDRLGMDPRMLSGRFAVVVHLASPSLQRGPIVDHLSGLGYRVEMLTT